MGPVATALPAGAKIPAARPRRRPAAVVFDMDGLMLDTEVLGARAWTDAALALGISFDSAVTARLIGHNSRDCEHLIREHHGEHYPAALLLRGWRVAFDAIVTREGIMLKAGLLELLTWLEARAIPRAVATSTRRARAEVHLRDAGVLERFAALVGGDEVAHGKPAPDIFLEAAARLGIAPGECVVLEDSEAGVQAALAAGMTPIMVPDLQTPSAELLACASIVVLPTLHAVQAHLSSGSSGSDT